MGFILPAIIVCRTPVEQQPAARPSEQQETRQDVRAFVYGGQSPIRPHLLSHQSSPDDNVTDNTRDDEKCKCEHGPERTGKPRD